MAAESRSVADISRGVEILRRGGVVAFPTETYYGLGVDPRNEQALRHLFAVKGRSSARPVLLLLPDREAVFQVAERVPEQARILMERFWPGPLTLVLPARSGISSLLTGGTSTIGVRLSPDPVALELLRAFGGPLTGTSANRSGEPAAVTAREVETIFGTDVDMVLDGGRTPGGRPSTLIKVTDEGVTCLREGAVPLNEVMAALADS